MSREREGGFALIASLWALVLVGALAGAYLGESRHILRVGDARKAELQARNAARAGIERVHNALERLSVLELERATQLDLAAQARLSYIWAHLDSSFAQLSGECLGDACYDVRVRDLATVLNVNLASESQLRRFLIALGSDYRQADIVAQSIADWIDGDDLHRARGAERAYYAGLRFPYRPRNAPINDIDELRRVRGMDNTLFRRVAPYLSVEGAGRINLNAAPEPVLAALPGLGPEGRRVVLDARRRGLSFANPFDLSSRLGPRGQAELQENFDEFIRLVSFEPQHIEVTSIGRFAGYAVRVPLRAVFLRSGGRVAELKRSRLDL